LRALLLLGAIVFLSGASASADDAAAVAALNNWWKEFTYSAPPVKPGTVKPAHTITSKSGKVYNIPKHVQTQKEYEAEAADARFADHKRSLVQGFSVKGQTVTVLTRLTRSPANIREARELCMNLGAFVWGTPTRHFGLQDIKITGLGGEVLSYRIGLAGKVQ
jgi:hypothetical protein